MSIPFHKTDPENKDMNINSYEGSSALKEESATIGSKIPQVSD
jgi:hypothetical protein